MYKEKKILFIDLDGVVADYYTATINKTKKQRKVKGFFEKLKAIKDSIKSIKLLSNYFNIYFASTAPWTNIFSWSEKRIWVSKKFGKLAFKKLILTHNKGLLKGDYLIDDRTCNGVDKFEGEHIHFGSEKFPDWNSIVDYLIKNKKYL